MDLELPPNLSICTAAQVSQLLSEHVQLHKCKGTKHTRLQSKQVFFFKVWLFPKKKSLWGQGCIVGPSFSLLPCHLCSVNHLRKNRKHLSECQQYVDMRTPFASNLIICIGLDIKYLMCAAVWWFCSASSKQIGSQNPNTSIGRENTPVCLKVNSCFFLFFNARSPSSEERFAGDTVWELSVSEDIMNASLPPISQGFFWLACVNLPTFTDTENQIWTCSVLTGLVLNCYALAF